jgi:ammonia channel protein AmtB
MEFFPEQTSLLIYVSSIFFLICSVALVGAVISFGLIDGALVRAKNSLDTWIQKLVAALIAGLAFLFIGYAIWIWQYYEAGVLGGGGKGLGQAISDWWLGGAFFTTFEQFINPALQFEAGVFQVFLIFFATFMGAAGALLHGAGLERIKPVATYVIAAVSGAIVIPVILYLTWGSTSPLTNRGVHDYVGLFGLYLYVGTFTLVLAKWLGPRLGSKYRPDSRTAGPQIRDLSMATIGVLVLICCVPWIALGCGFIIPDVAGYVGISMTTSGFGIAAVNVFAALFGGAVTGALLAYRLRNPFWALLGPLAGYVSGTAMFDITKPWIMILVALPAPLIAYATYRLLERLRIDEAKIIPLVLGPGIYAALMPGIVHWGTKTGGFIGITEGEFAFQNAEINLGWQFVGLAVTIGIAVVTAVVICFVLDRMGQLRVSEETELRGMDPVYWNEPEVGDLGREPLAPDVPMGAAVGVGGVRSK